MPRRKDMPCSQCGELMWRGSTSLPAGQARCHPCRRARPTVRELHTMTCAHCDKQFKRVRTGYKYCSLTCFARADGARRMIRAADDNRVVRGHRERDAPGMSNKARARMLNRWKTQHTTCTYCDQPADTIDHVIPLVRGGTNHEGNLTPACRRCNSSKGGLTIIEWQTGRRLARMQSAQIFLG
jgi:5-methylcytosine-specific restriction endonuclease McrA